MEHFFLSTFVPMQEQQGCGCCRWERSSRGRAQFHCPIPCHTGSCPGSPQAVRLGGVWNWSGGRAGKRACAESTWGNQMESKGYRRQGWAQGHISGCPVLSLHEGPSLHAEGGWMGVKMRLVREAYGILVQLGWADKPRQFFFYTRSSYV